jgi:hypothetical protein
LLSEIELDGTARLTELTEDARLWAALETFVGVGVCDSILI